MNNEYECRYTFEDTQTEKFTKGLKKLCEIALLSKTVDSIFYNSIIKDKTIIKEGGYNSNNSNANKEFIAPNHMIK